VAVSNQAISRNTKELVWSLGYIAAGPMTKQFFYESAAYLAASIPSGLSAQTCHPARAVLNDYITPMEMLGSVEINEACSSGCGSFIETFAESMGYTDLVQLDAGDAAAHAYFGKGAPLYGQLDRVPLLD